MISLTILVDETSRPLSIELDDNEDMLTLCQIIQLELSRPIIDFDLMYEGKIISHGSLRQNNIANNSIITVSPRVTTFTESTAVSTSSRNEPQYSQIPADVTPERLIEITQMNPQLLLQLASSDPPIADAINHNNLPQLRKLLMSRYLSHHKRIYETQQELRQIEQNPDSSENQIRIAERIQQDNIRENLENAIENMPVCYSSLTIYDVC